MKYKYKIVSTLFLVMLFSFFLVWVKGILNHGRVEEISALDIFSKGRYWPLLLSIIAPLLGIYFSYKKNVAFLFYSSIACVFNVVNFYFLLIPYGDRIGYSSDEFRKILQNNLAIGFYLFAIASAGTFILSAIEYGYLISLGKKQTNSETSITESNSVPAKLRLSKAQKLIGISLISIGLLFGGYMYWNKYKADQVKNKYQVILKKYQFLDLSDLTFYEGSNGKILTFDGNVATFTLRTMESINSSNDKSEKMDYTIRLEDGNKVYIDLITSKGQKKIYEFIQNNLGQTHLEGEFSFWVYDEDNKLVGKIEDIIDANLRAEAESLAIKSEALKTIIPTVDTTQKSVATNVLDTTNIIAASDTVMIVKDSSVKTTTIDTLMK